MKIFVSVPTLTVQAKILAILKVKLVSSSYLERSTSMWKIGYAVSGKQSWEMFFQFRGSTLVKMEEKGKKRRRREGQTFLKTLEDN